MGHVDDDDCQSFIVTSLSSKRYAFFESLIYENTQHSQQVVE